MKKVRNGVLCNTQTSTKIGSWEYSSGEDFSYCYEALYRTKSGRFFLYGQGGPRSKYAQMSGPNSWSGGEAIELLAPEDAREWAEEYLDGDEDIAAFGEPEEMYSTLIAEESANKLAALRRQTGKTSAQLIAEAIDQYFPEVLGD